MNFMIALGLIGFVAAGSVQAKPTQIQEHSRPLEMTTMAEVLHCFTATPARLLSEYESEIYGRPVAAAPGTTEAEKIAALSEKLNSLSPEVSSALPALSVIKSKARFVEENLFSVIADKDFTAIPINCELRQLIIKSQGHYLVSYKLWQLLSEEEKAAAWLQVAFSEYLTIGSYQSPVSGYIARTFAQAVANHTHMFSNLFDLPKRIEELPLLNIRPSLKYLDNFQIFYYPHDGWKVGGYWALQTNFGTLSSDEMFPVRFIGDKLHEIIFLSPNSGRSGTVGYFSVQAKAFELRYGAGQRLLLYPTGEVCGFTTSRPELLLDEAGNSVMVQEGYFYYFTKLGFLTSNQTTHLCE